MKKINATYLATMVYEENCPIDWGKISYIQRTYSRKDKIQFCRNSIEPFADGCSKHLITRAANILYYMIF